MLTVAIVMFLFSAPALAGNDVFEQVTHSYAGNEGVKIHYVTLGWGYAEIALTSHDTGGLTEFDLAVAKAIGKIDFLMVL